jgi:surface protein
MFYYCINLLSDDNISNWKKTKVIGTSHIFYYCTSLQLLTDISNWDFSKIDNFDLMLYNCFSLSPFPNLNNWMDNNKFVNSLIFGLSYINLGEIN